MKLDQIIKTPAGRRWAYFGVFLGFGASITANVASTVLRETTVSLLLRVPFAVFWPLATYVAIEVIVRTVWNKSLAHRGVRVVLILPVAGVAAFVSYLHQHHLMVLAGEPGLAQGFGPLAVDGMLFGMTATLIVTKLVTVPVIEEEVLLIPETKEEVLPPALPENASSLTLEEVLPISSPPAPRPPRASWDARKVIEMILDGAKNGEITGATGISLAPLGHLKRAVLILKDNPRASLPAGIRSSSENIALARELVSK